MGVKSKIQWTDSTVNPTMGCDGCELWKVLGLSPEEWIKICYSGNDVERRGAKWRPHLPPAQARDFSVVSQHPGRMAAAARWSDLTGMTRPDALWKGVLPRMIFVSDESDALSDAVSFDYLRDEIIANVTSPQGRRHQWQWLSKRPHRMSAFSDWLKGQGIRWPQNLWAGTSVTTMKTLTRAKQLLEVGDEKTLHFLSFEPQREEITLGDLLRRFDWAIQGGESRQKGDPSEANPFAMEWADAMREECRVAGVPYFLKQMGSHTTLGGQGHIFEFTKAGKPKLIHGGDWQQWDERFRVRQFPKPRRHVVSRLMLRRLAVR